MKGTIFYTLNVVSVSLVVQYASVNSGWYFKISFAEGLWRGLRSRQQSPKSNSPGDKCEGIGGGPALQAIYIKYKEYNNCLLYTSDAADE